MTATVTAVVSLLEDVPHTRVTRDRDSVSLRFSMNDSFNSWDYTTFTVTLPRITWTGEIAQARVAQSGAPLPSGGADSMRGTAAVLLALADVKDYLASEEVLAPMRAEAEAKEEQARKEREERREREAQEREARLRKQAEREALCKERGEQLLTEFLGEKVRIRLLGMKRWRPCTVESQECRWDDDGEATEWRPVLTYVFEKHGWRETELRRIAALEVKVGSRYRNVWDDGVEDLDTWHQGDVKVSKPYDGMPQ